jgi:hypothetical protein
MSMTLRLILCKIVNDVMIALVYGPKHYREAQS